MGEPGEFPVSLSPQDADHLLAAVEWALNHMCGAANEVTLDEYLRPGLQRWAVEEAARKIEAVFDLARQGITAPSIVAHVPRPTRWARLIERLRSLLGESTTTKEEHRCPRLKP